MSVRVDSLHREVQRMATCHAEPARPLEEMLHPSVGYPDETHKGQPTMVSRAPTKSHAGSTCQALHHEPTLCRSTILHDPTFPDGPTRRGPKNQNTERVENTEGKVQSTLYSYGSSTCVPGHMKPPRVHDPRSPRKLPSTVLLRRLGAAQSTVNVRQLTQQLETQPSVKSTGTVGSCERQPPRT
jgi:hypothetical protein